MAKHVSLEEPVVPQDPLRATLRMPLNASSLAVGQPLPAVEDQGQEELRHPFPRVQEVPLDEVPQAPSVEVLQEHGGHQRNTQHSRDERTSLTSLGSEVPEVHSTPWLDAHVEVHRHT